MDAVQTTLLGLVLLPPVIGLIAWKTMQGQRSRRFESRFSTEYGKTIKEFGSRTKAERELAKREMRVLDNPKGVVAEADSSVREPIEVTPGSNAVAADREAVQS